MSERDTVLTRLASGDQIRAVVIAVQLPHVSAEEMTSSMEELERLAKTLGLTPVVRVTQRRSRLAPGMVLGVGKLKELAAWTGGTGELPAFSKPGKKSKAEQEEDLDGEEGGLVELDDEEAGEPDGDAEPGGEPGTELEAAGEGAEGELDPTAMRPESEQVQVVLVDHDLSPTQQRNLERASGVDVLDRTSVILEIFHRHAKTREARLQVEIARLRYLAPRLRESGGGGDRVRGGIGGKGAGETSLELDKRRIRDRIAELRGELSTIEGGAKTRRQRRGSLPTVALVGYTNAGKSSLMRALTGSEVLVADKLFATLDTTVRALSPRTEPPILVSDTVGFIKKLPHDLVASFRSTLEEAGNADLLLHVVDAADPAAADQLAVTREVLREILAEEQPSWLILNKIDRVDEAGRAALAERYPGALQLSAKSPDDITMLHEKLVEHFAGALEETELDVPWALHRVLHELHERTTILSEEHHDEGTRVKVRAPVRVLEDVRRMLAGE